MKVEKAIADATLPEYLDQCNKQIGDLVQLVRGNLTPGSTITIEALVVLDVHGMLVNNYNYVLLINYTKKIIMQQETSFHF